MKKTSPWQNSFQRLVLEAKEKARRELQQMIDGECPNKLDK
jgi:hypothetical protein